MNSNWGRLGDFIRKIKYPHIRKGWRVHFVQSKNSYREFFADKDYGRKDKAFEAAKNYLEKMGNEEKDLRNSFQLNL